MIFLFSEATVLLYNPCSCLNKYVYKHRELIKFYSKKLRSSETEVKSASLLQIKLVCCSLPYKNFLFSWWSFHRKNFVQIRHILWRLYSITSPDGSIVYRVDCVVKSFSTDTPGYDHMSKRIFRENFDILGDVMLRLYNAIFEQGVFPMDL